MTRLCGAGPTLANLKYSLLVLMLGLSVTGTARAAAPLVRAKIGVSDLTMEAGERFAGEKLKSLITYQPTVLWDVPSFSSRIGFHFLSELNSPFGSTPISGIGVTGYYHIFGLSTSYELTEDDVAIQKSKPGPYLLASFTPVNVNLNKFDANASSTENFFVARMINEVMVGGGYDYPIMQNMLISGEFVIRNGNDSQSSSNSEKINYSGWTIFFSFATSYY